jgi:toluene monooxygenase system protein E
MAQRGPVKARRTYWHLEAQKRVPSAYDIGSSRLLYYPERGFEVTTPVTDWYRRHQAESPLQPAALARFRDPRETTYAKYVALADEKETFVDGLLRAADESDYDATLGAAWLASLERWLPVLLYPCHGLQMASAYVGQLAPTSELVIAFAFQTGDEMRRIQRLAYRVQQLATQSAGFRNGKAQWEQAAAWQPLRRVIEELLVTYDFGEALVTLCLVVKPLFDTFFMQHGGRLAEARRDPLLSRLFFSLNEDCRWHERFTDELVRVVAASDPASFAFVKRVAKERYVRARSGFGALEALWDPGLEPFTAVMASLDAQIMKRWHTLGLEAAA